MFKLMPLKTQMFIKLMTLGSLLFAITDTRFQLQICDGYRNMQEKCKSFIVL